jgi:hypothetical protein
MEAAPGELSTLGWKLLRYFKSVSRAIALTPVNRDA